MPLKRKPVTKKQQTKNGFRREEMIQNPETKQNKRMPRINEINKNK